MKKTLMQLAVSTMLLHRDAAGTGTAKVAERLAELRKAQKNAPNRRDATVGTIDVEARTVELSFSSEVEYERWWGIEVLGHAAGEVDLSRLQNKAALLWMHNWDDQRGVVESVSIDGDKGRAVVRFSRSEDGEQLFQDIVDGIVTKVSVGYTIESLKLVEEREGVDVYRVTGWTPYEISMVSIPADDTVGVGRHAEKPQEEAPPESGETPISIKDSAATRAQNKDQNSMKYRFFTDAQGNKCRVAIDDAGNDTGTVEITERASDIVTAAQTRGIDTERARVRAITEMGKQYGRTDLAMQHIADGKTAEDMQRVLLDDFARERGQQSLGEQQRTADVGLTEKEAAQFSIVRAIAYMADPTNKVLREAAAFEIEASRAAEKRYGKNAKGIIIPNEVLAARTFSVSGSAGTGAGAALVDNTTLYGSMIDMLRKKSWVMSRARTLAGLVGNIDIPRQNGGTSAYWVGEGQGPAKSNPTFDQIAFTPKTLGAKAELTRRLMMQASPDVENMVRGDILKSLRLEIDRAAIYADGTAYTPKGLKSFVGINTVSFGTPGSPSYANVVDMETQIALDDADVDNMSYAFGAAIRGKLKTTTKFGTGTEAVIWEQGNTVNGYATDVSNQIAAGEMWFGNWDDLVIAMWGGLEITVDPYSLSDSGGLKIVALQDIDMNVRHVESFCYGV